MKLIAGSKKPVLYTGGGIVTSEASGELLKFAEALHIPVASTLMGLGGFPGNHPLFLGMLGMRHVRGEHGDHPLGRHPHHRRPFR